MTDAQKKITAAFVRAYLDALPEGMDRSPDSFNHKLGEAIGAGLAVVLASKEMTPHERHELTEGEGVDLGLILSECTVAQVREALEKFASIPLQQVSRDIRGKIPGRRAHQQGLFWQSLC